MKEYKFEIPVQQKLIEELTGKEREWMDAAITAAEQAYAPYSDFQVGVAVILKSGTIITGNNQENAAYPSGLCAERVALFYAGARYPDDPVNTIVVAAMKDGIIQEEISPCGACRQVLFESEMRHNMPIQIMLCGKEVVRFIYSAAALLPFAFHAGNLQ